MVRGARQRVVCADSLTLGNREGGSPGRRAKVSPFVEHPDALPESPVQEPVVEQNRGDDSEGIVRYGYIDTVAAWR